jgi:hypothetical protein
MSSANNLLTADPTGTGTGQIQALTNGTSPMFPSPVATTDSPFAVRRRDDPLRRRGPGRADIVRSDHEHRADSAGNVWIRRAEVFVSAPLQVSIHLTALRKDLARLADFIGETRYTLHILAVDNTAEPKDFLSIAVPNFTLGSVDPSAFTKRGGPRTQTISIPAALVGQATDAANGFDSAMISFWTTTP